MSPSRVPRRGKSLVHHHTQSGHMGTFDHTFLPLLDSISVAIYTYTHFVSTNACHFVYLCACGRMPLDLLFWSTSHHRDDTVGLACIVHQALGLVLYEVLIGAYPWDYASNIDPDYMAFKTSITSTVPWSGFPPGLLAVISSLFTEDVRARANAADVLA